MESKLRMVQKKIMCVYTLLVQQKCDKNSDLSVHVYNVRSARQLSANHVMAT